MKLSVKVTLLILVTAAITSLVAGILVFNSTRVALQQSIGDQQRELARQTMDKIDRLLYERYLDILEIAEEEDLIRFLSLDGTDLASVKQKMDKLRIVSGPWDVLSLVDEDGIAMATTYDEGVGKPIEEKPQDRIAYKSALETNVYFSDLVVSEETGKPTIIFSASMRNKFDVDRPVVGVIIGHYSWPVVLEILEDVSAHAVLLNSKGVVIGHNTSYSDADLFFKNFSGEDFVQEVLIGEFGSEILSPGQSFIEEEVLASYTSQLGHLDYAGSGWGLVLEVPTSIAFAPATQTGVNLVLLLIPIIVLASFTALVLITRVVIRPIDSLTRTSQAIAAGDLNRRVQVTSKDEIGQLAMAFNEMTTQLQQSYESLEEKVKELQAEHARLKASIDNLPLGYFIIEASHNIVVLNPAMREILGSREKKWTFQALQKRFQPSGIDLRQLCAHCRGEKKPFIVKEVAFDDKFLRIFSVPILMDQDHEEIIGTAILAEDITEAKLLERLKEEFFAVASHELRTPLTAIRGNASLLQYHYAEKLEDEDMREMISDIHDASIRLIEIVNDFLDVSRLEQGRITFKKELVDLKTLIRDTIQEVKGTAADKSLYLKLEEPEGKMPKALADKDRTKQVLINLIGNAVKFTEKGGVRIEIRSHDKILRVWVHDTGIGMSKKNQKLLFRKFQHAGEKILTRDVTRGTGMGLYICKLLVEGMGGKIYLERSAMNKGSSFVFSLPVAPTVGAGQTSMPDESTRRKANQEKEISSTG